MGYIRGYEKEFGMLVELNENFSMACLAKLTKKLGEGYTGWDYDATEPFRQKIIKLSKEELTQKNLVNIANYCSFLWHRKREEQKELIKINKTLNRD